MRRLPPLLALALACRAAVPAPAPPAAGAGDLVAVVQDQNQLFCLRRSRSANVFHEHTRLPADARSLRFSPDGRAVAWVQDDLSGERPRMLGFYRAPGAKEPTALGELGLRKVEGGGLAVGAEGNYAFVDAGGELVRMPGGLRLGKGAWPLFGTWPPPDPTGDPPGRPGLVWVDARTGGCRPRLRHDPRGTHMWEACGPALRPLDADALLHRDNAGLWQYSGNPFKPTRLFPAASDVLDARIASGGRVLAISREVVDGVTAEALHVGAAADPVFTAPVIVSAEWDDDGSVLVVARREPTPLTDRLLAHAPDEFGGEALAGEALRVAPDGSVRSVEGLAGRAVRALFRAR